MGWYPGKNLIEAIQKGAADRRDDRQLRLETKSNVKAVAYSNGIDPNASWAGATSDMVSGLGNAASNIFGVGLGEFDLGSLFGGGKGSGSAPIADKKNQQTTLFVLLGVGVVLWLIFGRSR